MLNFILRWSTNHMAKFKVIVSDPETGTSKIVELEEARAAPLIGRKIGEAVDGAVVDLPAHKLQITGGSDRDGVPMRRRWATGPTSAWGSTTCSRSCV